MLVYHPLFDPYHCEFRMLRLLAYASGRELREDALRIYDFYLCLPYLLSTIEQTRKSSNALKRLAIPEEPNRYMRVPDKRLLFQYSTQIQEVSLRNLLAQGIIAKEKFLSGLITLTDRPLPGELVVRIAEKNADERELMRFLVDILGELAVSGPRGLKARTGLMEYRYDAV